MRTLTAAALAVSCIAAPALAGTTCNFNVECYMTDACTGAGWELTVDFEAGRLSSLAEDLTILHAGQNGTQVFAAGAGSLNLLSIGEEISLFTSHIEGEPTAITYVGECMSE